VASLARTFSFRFHPHSFTLIPPPSRFFLLPPSISPPSPSTSILLAPHYSPHFLPSPKLTIFRAGCLVRLWDLGGLPRPQCGSGCSVPHHLPRRRSRFVWCVRCCLAGFEPRSVSFFSLSPRNFSPFSSIALTLRLTAFCAIIWYGVQAWIGGEATYVLIRSIWPSFTQVPNGIPSSGTDTAHFVSFFLFSFVSLFAIYPRLHTIRHLFTLKALVTPVAAVALMVWCLVKAKGAGDLLSAPATVKGSALGWAFVSNMMNWYAPSFLLPSPDLTSSSLQCQ
jgi:hypothetical protein